MPWPGQDLLACNTCFADIAHQQEEPMIMRKVPIKISTVASAMALSGILGDLKLKVNGAIICAGESWVFFTLLLGIPVARLVRDSTITHWHSYHTEHRANSPAHWQLTHGTPHPILIFDMLGFRRDIIVIKEGWQMAFESHSWYITWNLQYEVTSTMTKCQCAKVSSTMSWVSTWIPSKAKYQG